MGIQHASGCSISTRETLLTDERAPTPITFVRAGRHALYYELVTVVVASATGRTHATIRRRPVVAASGVMKVSPLPT